MATTTFETVIGLEVHAQLLTESKIFCGCSTKFGAQPNENTCPVCLGLPGALPVINETAISLAVRAGIAFSCEIPERSIFARKNYFYPDLPKGYQISQYDSPLAVDGCLDINTRGEPKRIRIKRIHMEEDAGKLVHEAVDADKQASFVDLNRSGVPLIEIVTEPDLSSPEEAYEYLTELKAILQYAEISSANMEEGKLRCDANISLRPRGAGALGTKVEIKNLNSFKNVQKAIEYEIGRQDEALRKGETIIQETRLFNADKGITEPMRSKEEAHDYRYFPDPDILPLPISDQLRHTAGNSVPELPRRKRERFEKQFSVNPSDALVLTEERLRADRFEETARLSGNSKQSANWILRAPDAPINPAFLAELIALIERGAINMDQGKMVFQEMLDSSQSPEQIVKQRGLAQISDLAGIGSFVDAVIAQNSDLVGRYKNGETKLLGVLVGQIMKASGGKTNPATVNALLREKLR